MAGSSREQRLYDALKAIASYQSPEKLRKNSWGEYGCSPEDAVQMAYENVLEEAKIGIKGMRRPKD